MSLASVPHMDATALAAAQQHQDAQAAQQERNNDDAADNQQEDNEAEDGQQQEGDEEYDEQEEEQHDDEEDGVREHEGEGDYNDNEEEDEQHQQQHPHDPADEEEEHKGTEADGDQEVYDQGEEEEQDNSSAYPHDVRHSLPPSSLAVGVYGGGEDADNMTPNPLHHLQHQQALPYGHDENDDGTERGRQSVTHSMRLSHTTTQQSLRRGAGQTSQQGPSSPSMSQAVYALAAYMLKKTDGKKKGEGDIENPNKPDGGDSGDGGDDPEDDPLLEPLPEGVDIVMRIGMLGISLILLWITSLSLANYMAASAVGNPAYSPVYDSWYAAYTVADQEADVHGACVDRLQSACATRLNNSINQAEVSWQASEVQRKQVLLSVQLTSDTCATESSNVLKGIDTWMQHGATLTYQSTLVCTPAELDALRYLLNDKRDNTAALKSLQANYLTSTSTLFNQTTDQVVAVQDYNEAYVENSTQWINKKLFDYRVELDASVDPTFLIKSINEKLDRLALITNAMRDCAAGVSISEPNMYCPTSSLVDAYSLLVVQLEIAYKNLQSISQNTLARTANYVSQVTDKFAQIQSLYNTLYPITDALAQLNVYTASFPVLDIFPLAPDPDLKLLLANPVSIPSIQTSFRIGFAGINASWSAEFNDASRQMRKDLADTFTNISLNTPSLTTEQLLLPYNPPDVRANMTGLKTAFDQSSEIFRDETEASVNSLLSIPSILPENTSYVLPTNDSAITVPPLPSISDLSSHDVNTNIETFHGTFSFSSVFIAFVTTMAAALFVLDYVYRSLSSVRMILSYTKQPQEILPPMDTRTDANKKHEEEQRKKASIFVKVAYILTNPTVVAVIALILVAWIIGLFLSLYLPMYESYEDNCVNNAKGTFLSTNAYALLYNYASVKGNTKLLLSMTGYEAQRAMACGRHEQRVAASTADDTYSRGAAFKQQKNAYANMALIGKCLAGVDGSASTGLDQDALNPLAAITPQLLSTCQVSGGVDVTNGAGIGGISSQSQLSSSIDTSQPPSSSYSSLNHIASQFNCSSLPACNGDAACSGPAVLAITSSTHDSSCQTEYTFHQSLFFFSFSFLIFVCLNLSRYCAMKAVVRMCWKALTPKGMQFIATCDQQGNIKRGDDEKKDEDEAEDSDIHQKASALSVAAATKISLRSHILQYEQDARTYLILTLVSHLPYLLLLFALKDPMGMGSKLKIAEPTPYMSHQ